MGRRRRVWIAWCAVVVAGYAVLGIAAYAIGPVRSQTPCDIVGHGAGLTAGGDRSAFRVFVVASPPEGLVSYTDEGATAPLQLHNVHISTVTCSMNGEAGTVTGTVDLKAGESPVGFRLDVGTTGSKRTLTFRFSLADGYDSGTETPESITLEIRGHRVSTQ